MPIDSGNEFYNCIQVAGFLDIGDATGILSEDVDFLGIPLYLPVNKADFSPSVAADLVAQLPSETRTVLITYQSEATQILTACRQLQVNYVQLHSSLSVQELQQLRTLDPSLKVIKSLVIREDNLDDLKAVVDATSPYVDAFITDTFDARTGACGATGLVHDWAVSAALVEHSELPVILAGGLNPLNVADAIKAVRPAGVDAHTGLETVDGRKSAAKLRQFVAAARSAFHALA